MSTDLFGGRREEVYVNPRGHSGRNGPSGGGLVNVNVDVFLDGESIDRKIRYRISDGQGTYK